MKEIWKVVPGYTDYEVSDTGHVRFLNTKRKCRIRTDHGGYYEVRLLGDNGYKKYYRVHQVVLLAFVGPCPKKREPCHFNDIKSDNKLKNLRYGTRGDNLRDAYRNGRISKEGRTMKEARAAATEWRKKNKTKFLRHMRKAQLLVQQWRKDNPDKVNAICSRMREGSKKWKDKNPEKHMEIVRKAVIAVRKWREENPKLYRESRMKAKVSTALFWKNNPDQLRERARKAHETRRRNVAARLGQ